MVGGEPTWVPKDTEDYFLPHICAPAQGFPFALYIPLLFASISTPSLDFLSPMWVLIIP